MNHNGEYIIRIEKRNKFEIYYDILHALRSQIAGREKVSLTLAASQANLPYNRFQKALALLISLGFCYKDDNDFVITKKGDEYLAEYKKINEFFQRMGFYP